MQTRIRGYFGKLSKTTYWRIADCVIAHFSAHHSAVAKLIKRINYPNMLIYAVPPYVIGAKQGKRKKYNCEMTDEGRAALLEVLISHIGPVLLSSYGSVHYADLLRGWYRETVSALVQISDKRTEAL